QCRREECAGQHGVHRTHQGIAHRHRVVLALRVDGDPRHPFGLPQGVDHERCAARLAPDQDDGPFGLPYRGDDAWKPHVVRISVGLLRPTAYAAASGWPPDARPSGTTREASTACRTASTEARMRTSRMMTRSPSNTNLVLRSRRRLAATRSMVDLLVTTAPYSAGRFRCASHRGAGVEAGLKRPAD